MRIKKSKILVTIILTVILLLSFLQIETLATDSSVIVVKENDNQYFIYIDEVMNENFNFAFSNTKENAQLNYTTAAKDSDENYIAYVNEQFKNQYFNSENTYIWIKTKDEKVILDGEKITLDDAKMTSQLNEVKNITKKITVNSTAEEEKIKINGEEGKKYYYQFDKLNSSEEYTKLLELTTEISKYDENTNTFLKLKKYSELYQLYNSLIANLENKNWVETTNLEITKPYDAKENEQYILWLKDEKGTIDIQLLKAYEKTITTVNQRVEEKEVTSVLPYTYDDTTILFVALGVVLVASFAIIIFKIVSNHARKE